MLVLISDELYVYVEQYVYVCKVEKLCKSLIWWFVDKRHW